MTDLLEPDTVTENGQPPLSLGTAAARNLATTTKSVPQMQGITSRWLLRLLPWVQASGGTYRVNRRLSYLLGDGRVSFTSVGADVRVIPQELREMPLLRDFDDDEVLGAIADRFVQREYEPGAAIVRAGEPADQIILIAHGKVNKVGVGKYGDDTILAVLADGDHFSYRAILETGDTWDFTARAVTRCTVLSLSQEAFEQLVAQSDELRAHIDRFLSGPDRPYNPEGEVAIEVASGHAGEPDLPGTYVDYETSPREYELSVAQTVLRVHSRVADLYNQPMNQVEQQLRLTIEAVRERQEFELVNNRDFGLLYNADLSQRISTRTGPPTPDDLDELISRRRKTRFLFAHPRAIAAFGQECTRRGVYPHCVDIAGRASMTWRGIPLLPCDKIPISHAGTTSILAMRVGEESNGVIGLHETGIPDEYQPGLSVRFMGIDDKAIISYLVSAYFSVAVLVPSALGVLENVELGRSA